MSHQQVDESNNNNKTVYKDVIYEGKGSGTLTLYDDRLMFAPSASGSRVFSLPWKKVSKRYVSSSDAGKAKTRMVLKSGTEVTLQMEDRISLEILRDDLGDRIRNWKKNNPEEEEEEEEAINKTKNRESGKRQSTPYSYAKPQSQPDTSLQKQQRESQPYRFVKKEDPSGSTPQQRESQPYRMKAKEKPKQAQPRESQPYRFVAKEKPKPSEQRASQPYRYIAKPK